ncbi:MAG: acyl-CoA dehydrogenase family protein [Bifidobacteriaceae bacterium]|jgi:alkylation response protein AidB-like acyl-CoA dehydrogenase|nr:acyl-CoA dehydrogenase family protein [Bifidobacteriaceae bacterium]
MWYMNDERELVRQAARDFAEKEIRPQLQSMEIEHKYPKDLVKRMGELGFSGWPHKKAVGGSEGDWVTYGLIMEEIAKVSTTMGVLLMLQTTLCSGPIAMSGTPEQQEKWLKPVFAGKKVMAVSATEPVGVAQWYDWQSRAKFDEATQEWVVDAHKIFTTGAGEADIYVINVLTEDPDLKTGRGTSTFVLSADTPGVGAGHIENKLGWNGSSTGAMNYECRLPADALVGEAGAGMTMPPPGVIDPGGQEAMVFGPMSLGAAEGVYERALSYVKQRKRDGGTLYSNFQAVRYSLARMWLAIEQFRGYVYASLDLVDRGAFTVPQGMGAKVMGAELMQFVGKEAVMIAGGQGVIQENAFELVYRDGLVNAIGGGSNYTFLDAISQIVTGDGPPPPPPE